VLHNPYATITVTTNVKVKQNSMSKPRQLIIFAIIVVVLIGASVGAALWWSNYQVSKTSQTSKTGENSSKGSPMQSTPAEKTADDADQLAYQGDVQAGVKKLDEAIENTSDNQELFTYYSRKATLLLNNNELSGALEAAKKAYTISTGSESGALVAQIAEQMGNKTLAAEYYQNAIDHVDKTDPYAKSDTEYYQSKIRALQGGQ
jgi:tetratricopeptide (TPR) repeat protein